MAASDSFNTPTENCENLQAGFAALQRQAFCTSLLQIMFFAGIHSREAFGNALALLHWRRTSTETPQKTLRIKPQILEL